MADTEYLAQQLEAEFAADKYGNNYGNNEEKEEIEDVEDENVYDIADESEEEYQATKSVKRFSQQPEEQVDSSPKLQPSRPVNPILLILRLAVSPSLTVELPVYRSPAPNPKAIADEFCNKYQLAENKRSLLTEVIRTHIEKVTEDEMLNNREVREILQDKSDKYQYQEVDVQPSDDPNDHYEVDNGHSEAQLYQPDASLGSPHQHGKHNSISLSKSASALLPPGSRLYNLAEQRRQARKLKEQKAYLERKTKEDEEYERFCTFQPEVTPLASNLQREGREVWQRICDWSGDQVKNEHLKIRRRVYSEQDEESTFKPKVNPISTLLVQNSRKDDFSIRLYEEQKTLKGKREQERKQQEFEDERRRKEEFAQIASKTMKKNANLVSTPNNFLTRSKDWSSRNKTRAAQRAKMETIGRWSDEWKIDQKSGKMEKHTVFVPLFTPQINPHSNDIASTHFRSTSMSSAVHAAYSKKPVEELTNTTPVASVTSNAILEKKKKKRCREIFNYLYQQLPITTTNADSTQFITREHFEIVGRNGWKGMINIEIFICEEIILECDAEMKTMLETQGNEDSPDDAFVWRLSFKEFFTWYEFILAHNANNGPPIYSSWLKPPIAELQNALQKS